MLRMALSRAGLLLLFIVGYPLVSMPFTAIKQTHAVHILFVSSMCAPFFVVVAISSARFDIECVLVGLSHCTFEL